MLLPWYWLLQTMYHPSCWCLVYYNYHNLHLLQWYVFFINVHSYFISGCKHNIKNIGDCISKINKNHFFAFEEEMKNDILFFKGRTRCIIEMCARDNKYTGIYFIRKHSETFAPLQTGMWWINHF